MYYLGFLSKKYPHIMSNSNGHNALNIVKGTLIIEKINPLTPLSIESCGIEPLDNKIIQKIAVTIRATLSHILN